MHQFRRTELLQNHGIDYGDVSQRIALRKSLQCRSFQWYLDNVYPEMRRYNNTLYYGEVSHRPGSAQTTGWREKLVQLSAFTEKYGINQR